MISLKLPALHGTLKSSKSACLRNRTVTVYHRRGHTTTTVGHDRTSSRGKRTVSVPKLHPGFYFASVAKQGACGAGRSKSFEIE